MQSDHLLCLGRPQHLFRGRPRSSASRGRQKAQGYCSLVGSTVIGDWCNGSTGGSGPPSRSSILWSPAILESPHRQKAVFAEEAPRGFDSRALRHFDHVAKRRGVGLQPRRRRFESGRGLHLQVELSTTRLQTPLCWECSRLVSSPGESSGCRAVWLTLLLWEQAHVGSNPITQTISWGVV